MSVNIYDATQDTLKRVDGSSFEYEGAGYHNSIYRGKNLGSSVTAAQWNNILNGTFQDMFIGDYWRINNVNWRIAAFDYWINTCNPVITDHHVVIVPDTNLLEGDGSTNHYMQTSNDTSGGYKGSGYYSGTNKDTTTNTAKSECTTKVNNAFGSGHILTYKELITSTVADGKASAWSWEDCTVECMNETMICGGMVWGISGYEVGIKKTPLPLFLKDPSKIVSGSNYWIRSIKSATEFAFVSSQGIVNFVNASSSGAGIRPVFAIYQPQA